jgi:hypothetical protein
VPRSERFDHSINLKPNTFDVAGDIVVPKSQHGNSLCVEPTRSEIILRVLNGFAMLPAVQFDRQADRRAIKIQNEIADRMLATKSKTCDLISA